MRFEGEFGYTTVDAHSAHGHLLRSARRVCKKGGFDPSHSGGNPFTKNLKVSTLIAISATDGRRVTFIVFGFETASGKTNAETFAAAFVKTSERVGKMMVSRGVFVIPPGEGLLVSPPGVVPASATVALPSPFQGTSSYLENPGSAPTWEGSLKVDLPGLAALPLTGPAFAAKLCPRTLLKALAKCLAPADTTSGGSQSAVATSAKRTAGQSQSVWIPDPARLGHNNLG